MFRWVASLFQSGPKNSRTGLQSSPEPIELGIASIPGAVASVEELPQPRWELIAFELEKRFADADPELIWNSAALEWLHLLRQSLGSTFRVHSSSNFLYLTAKSSGSQRYLSRTAENALAQIRHYFGEAGKKSGYGKYVIIFLEDEQTYYRYISHFYPSGEYPTSGAIFINRGYRHLVLKPSYALEGSLVHELCHCVDTHLPLPRWLDEGLAQWMEARVADYQRRYKPDIFERHHRFWTSVTIQQFWSGESFYKVGDSSELSYSLAAILIQLLHEDFGSAVKPFIAEAHFADAGQAAAQKHLKLGLGALVQIFLGPGEWEPSTQAAIPQERDPYDGKSQLIRELILAGRVEDARSIWEQVISAADSDKQRVSILDQLASIPVNDNCDHFIPEALELCVRALALSPDQHTIQITRGALLVRSKKPHEARAILVPLPSGAPKIEDQAAASYFLAAAELQLGDRQRAETAFKRAVELAPEMSLRTEIEAELFGIPESKLELDH